MGEATERWLRVGELAARAGVNPRTVRYYESIGLLPAPRRGPNGYRLYGPGDLARLRFVRRAQSLGLSLGAIGDILALADAGEWPCARVRAAAERRIAEIDRQIAELQRLRDHLSELAGRAEQLARVGGSPAGGASGTLCPAIEPCIGEG